MLRALDAAHVAPWTEHQARSWWLQRRAAGATDARSVAALTTIAVDVQART
jgi:hypothetical protein